MPLHPVVAHHIVNTLQWPALRPMQQAAVQPILDGSDALLIAPTAGGKTEAVAFPLLTRMADEQWRGLSTLYICPLRALLNNLEPRLQSYAAWLGRRAAVWHGDIGAGVRRRMVADPPDLLLTTPESLEAILVSASFPAHEVFAELQTVVIDEVHAFAGDDRGWHLLAVLERLSRIAGRPLQRIGLSATVGNPPDLLKWLQGSNRDTRAAHVIAPPAEASATSIDLQLDYVGTVDNAAIVISALHQGETRLVFADSRRRAEALAVALQTRDVSTFVSHSSLSVDERRRAEQAFAEARNCVIVATSTLELGVDVGDLDRVLQIGAPQTVASFLQRLGRTGRRDGSTRNTLFLATTDNELLQTAGLLVLLSEGYVEPVVPSPFPRHLLSQQLLALCLQENRVGDHTWDEWLGNIDLASPRERDEIVDWLLQTGHLDSDGGMLFVGPQAERAFGRRHFLELVSVFTAAPELIVLSGNVPIGTIDPMVLTSKITGPRVLALAGRSWVVRHVEWRQRKVWVEPTDTRGSSRWAGAPQPWSHALADATRCALLGASLGDAGLSKRATSRLSAIRAEFALTVDETATVITHDSTTGTRWWTWAGGRANAVLASAIAGVRPDLIDEVDRYDNRYLRLSERHSPGDLNEALHDARRAYGPDLTRVPFEVSDDALKGLKFAELLPPGLAKATLARRSLDPEGAVAVASRPIIARPGG